MGFLNAFFRKQASKPSIVAEPADSRPQEGAVKSSHPFNPLHPDPLSYETLEHPKRRGNSTLADEPTPTKEFFSSIAGISYTNTNGTSRQEIASHVTLGEVLELRLEDDNPYDSEAVAVYARHGQIGYLHAGPDSLAEEVRGWLAKGWRVKITAHDLTGGTEDKPYRGINILVQAWAPG